METTYNFDFKDKKGKLISDQDGINYAKSLHNKNNVNIYKYFTLYQPHYGVCAAETGRWTSAYHGLPGACDIKGCFIPFEDDQIFLHADFAQNEYKVFAALAKEEAIIQAFREGKDIHRFIASKVFNKLESEITPSERNVAKRLSFGLLYGKGIPAIAEEYFRGDVKYAQKLFDDFFVMFPRIKAYMREQEEMLFEKGYITTVFGDPIYIEYDKDKKSSVNEAKRYASNYPTQSTASLAAALVGERILEIAQKEKWDLWLGGFIHDCEEGCFGVDYLFPIFEEFPKTAEQYPFDTYRLPMSIDIELGVCGGPGLVEFKRQKGNTAFMINGQLKAKFEGETQYVNQLFDKFRAAGYIIELDKVEEEEDYQSWSEMFLRVASSYRSGLGKTLFITKGLITISKPEKLLIYHPESEAAFYATEEEFNKMQNSADGQLCVIITIENPLYKKIKELAEQQVAVYGR
jgi:DNA polymerase family A